MALLHLNNLTKYILLPGIMACQLFCLNASFAQKQFETVYGGPLEERSRGVIQTENNEYIVLGMTESFGSGDKDISITRLDVNGEILWSKALGTPIRDASYDIMAIPSGDYLIAAWVLNNPPSYDDWYVIKIDDDGNILSEKFFGGSHDDEIMSMEIALNGDFVMTGSSWSFASTLVDILITRMDDNFNVIWAKTFEGGIKEYSRSIIQCSDGGFILLGAQRNSYDQDNQILVLKIDGNGNLDWSKKISGANETWGWDIIETDDGSYLTVGYIHYSGYDNDIFINNIDSEGNLLWSKTYDGSNDDRAFEIKRADNGTYFISGFTNSFGAGGYDVLLLNIDESGNVIKAFTFGGEDDEMNSFLDKTSDGGFIIASQTKSYGNGNFDNFIIKTDENGNSCCGSEVTDISVEVFTPDVSDLSMSTDSEIEYPTHNINTINIDLTNTYLCVDSIHIIGEDSVCAFATNIPFTIYPNIFIELDWILPEGASIAQSLNDTTIFVNFGNTSGYIYLQTTGCSESIVDSIFINISDAYPANLGNDTLLCSNQSFVLDPGIGFTNYLWQNGSEDSSIVVSSSGTYWVEVVNINGCTSTDTIHIGMYPPSNVNLGNDTSVCSNQSLVLDPGIGFLNYLWQDGSQDSSFVVFGSGTYWVEIVDINSCSSSDTIQVDLNPVPDIEIGNDTLLCLGDSLILNAGGGYTAYYWNNGSIDSSIVVDTSGYYFVEVFNEFDCSIIDSIYIEIYPMAFEELELGPDTILCSDENLVINAGSGYTFYQWQDGSSDSIFIADTAGVYWVYVENPCSSGSDTIVLYNYPLNEIELGNDTALCQDESILLDPGFGFQSYLWQDGSSNQFLNANQTGAYWIEAMDENACFVYDTINLEFVLPDPDIGSDTTICSGDSVTFYASNGFVNYLWNNGSDQMNLTTYYEGLIWCEVIDTIGCMGSDSVYLEILFPPAISLGNDTSFCEGDSLQLLAFPWTYDYDINWMDSSSDSGMLVWQEGMYWVMATNFCGTTTDSVFVYVNQLPFVFIGNDTLLTLNSQIVLNAGTGFQSYLWNEGSESQTITISEGGSYWVNVFDGQCYNTDTIYIEPIECDLFIPIVFTPNGDSYNDYFYAESSKDIVDFNLTVFTRWGEVIWETENKDDKWDGNYKGRKADDSTYFWILQYKCLGSDQQFEKKGSVTLLR